MDKVIGAVLLALPLAACVAAVWYWRGGYRYMAMVPLPVVSLAYAADALGMLTARGSGSLAGILTLIVALPALGLLFALVLLKGFSEWTTRAWLLAGLMAAGAFLTTLFVALVVIVGTDMSERVNIPHRTALIATLVTAALVSAITFWSKWKRADGTPQPTSPHP